MSGKYPGGIVTAGAPAGFSVAFDGNGDYLSFTNNSTTNLGTGDFTYEAWIYPTALNSYNMLFASGTSNHYLALTWGATSSIYNLNAYNGAVSVGSTPATIPINQWVHIAYVRISGTLYYYVNGVANGSSAFSGTFGDSTGTATIGYNTAYAGSYYFNGYMSNVRMIKGTGIYTGNFTPPTQLFPITNTSLLICQSPRIIDNSINAFAITANGDAKVSNFTPFTGYTAGAAGFQPALGAAAPGVWTLSQAETYQGNRQWPIYDPNFNQTTLMLHGNSPTNLPTWITDASSNNFAVTVNGDTKASNQTPFNTSWSNNFGGAGNYLTNTTAALIAATTTTFTAEAWIFMTSAPTSDANNIGSVVTLDGQAAGASNYMGFGPISNQKLYLRWFDGSGKTCNGSTTLALNTWYHIALVVNANAISMYVNGVAETLTGTTTLTNRNGTSGNFAISANAYTSFSGNISNLRVCTSAVYTGAFTPSSSPLTTTSQGATGCVLLTCQSSRFADNSTNAYALTVGGTATSIQYFNPFGTSLVGGSGLFNGSTDYLSAASNSAFAPGTGDFAIQCWVYFNSVSGTILPILQNDAIGTSSSDKFWLGIQSNTLKLGQHNTANAATCPLTPLANQWYSIAVSRVSGTIYMWINGVSQTVTNSTVFSSTSFSQNGLVIGAMSTPYYLSGYLSNFQYQVGTGFTSFSLPTAPIATPGTNAKLLTLQNTQPTANNSFTDSSNNNFAITRVGSTTQGTFTPFSQTGYSMYLDGSSSLSYPTSANTLTGVVSGNKITYEFWYYCTGIQAITAYNTGIAGAAPAVAVNGRWTINLLGSSTVSPQQASYYWTTSPSTGDSVSSTILMNQNQWHHVAICIDATTPASSTITIYCDGIGQTFTGKNLSSQTTDPGYQQYIGSDGSVQALSGYISNFRIVRGSLVYTSNFTPPTAPLTPIAGTVILACQNNRFVDNSAANYTLGAVASGTPRTQSFTPFVATNITPTTYSNYFNGSTGYLSWSGSAVTTEFTFECWFNYTGNFGSISAFVGPGSAVTNALNLYINNSTSLAFDQYGVTATAFTVPTMSANQWYHVVFVRNSSNQATVFLNGVRSSTGAVTISTAYANIGAIGYVSSAVPRYFQGALSNVRYVTSALYDPTQTTITVPTAPFSTDTPNQQLLTCQSSTLIDANTATTAKTLTATGTVYPVTSPTPFSPLVDQTTMRNVYSTSLIGGSAYFNGSTDYLSLNPSPLQNLYATSVPFTLEFWLYPTAFGSTVTLLTATTAANTNSGWWMQLTSGGVISWIIGGTALTAINQTIPLGAWSHYAVVWNGTTLTSYLNGSNAKSASTSWTNNGNNNVSYIGTLLPGTYNYYYTGYLSGMRLVVGTQVYTGAFVPPSAPPTSVTNTQLLTNFTNAAVIDNTSKNDLITFSSSGISTVQSKYGGSSLKFNGTSDYLRFPPNQSFNFANGDFTVEFWIYRVGNGSAADNRIFQTADGDVYTGITLYESSGAVTLLISTTGGSWALNISVGTISAAWSHIAVSRAGGNLRTFVNGVVTSTNAITSPLYYATTETPVIAGQTSGRFFNGYIDDFRISKVGRYVGNFTPPTSQLQDQ